MTLSDKLLKIDEFDDLVNAIAIDENGNIDRRYGSADELKYMYVQFKDFLKSQYPELDPAEVVLFHRLYHKFVKLFEWKFNDLYIRMLEWECLHTGTPLIRTVSTAIKEIEDMHPYKESGNRESYSKYSEGWSDACDLVEQRVIQILKEQ